MALTRYTLPPARPPSSTMFSAFTSLHGHKLSVMGRRTRDLRVTGGEVREPLNVSKPSKVYGTAQAPRTPGCDSVM